MFPTMNYTDDAVEGWHYRQSLEVVSSMTMREQCVDTSGRGSGFLLCYPACHKEAYLGQCFS